MASYPIIKSDGTAGPSIADSASPDTQTDLQLVGQNAISYGLDVAQSFYFLLENFAADAAPTTGTLGRVTGQLWYDTVNNKLQLYDGGWTALLTDTGHLMPSVDSTYDIGTTTGPFRWRAIHGDNITAESAITGATVVGGTVTASSSLVASGTTSLVGATTTTAATGDFTTGANTKLTIGVGDGARDLAAFRISPSTTPTTLSDGDVWVTAAGAFNVRVNGSTIDLAAAAGAAVDSFISRTGAVVAVATDYATFYPRKDASAGSDTIDALRTWTFANRPVFNGGTTGVDSPFTVDSTFVVANLNADLVDGVEGSALALDAAVVHDTGAESVAGIKTFTDIIKANTGVAGAGQGVRVLGFASTDSTNSGFFSVYHQDEGQEQVRMGTSAGSAFSEVRALTGDLNLYASNTLVMNLNSTASTMTSGSVSAMLWRATGAANISTTAGVYDSGTTVRNVGYNETPSITIAGTVAASVIHVGKFLTRTAVTVTTVQLPNGITAIPTGGSFVVHNDNVTGTLSIDPTGTAVLEWIDGSGSLPTTSVTRVIAYNGVATIRKKSDAVWQIWGNGIS